MNNSRASERYAKSLLTLSIDENLLGDVKSDIDMLMRTFSSSREISNLYINPIIPIHHKVEITKQLFENKINRLTLNLLLNVIYRKRDSLIESICLKFIELYNLYKNIVESSITTTTELDDITLDDIKIFAEKVSNKKVSLAQNIDKNIIGGFNLKIGDKMYDCTISSKINELKKELINN
tara:strand:+ start:1663 stop:2202 length:540 start_codon:yes stop_codon:yes gene_type:complete